MMNPLWNFETVSCMVPRYCIPDKWMGRQKDGWMDRWKDKPEAISPINFFKVVGHKKVVCVHTHTFTPFYPEFHRGWIQMHYSIRKHQQKTLFQLFPFQSLRDCQGQPRAIIHINFVKTTATYPVSRHLALQLGTSLWKWEHYSINFACMLHMEVPVVSENKFFEKDWQMRNKWPLAKVTNDPDL